MIQTFEPAKDLRRLVDYIWIVKEDRMTDAQREDIIMPLGHFNIVFNYASPYQWIENQVQQVVPNAAVIGQMKTAKHVRYGPRLEQIGIALRPLGFLTWFDRPAYELTERIVLADEVDPDLLHLYPQLRLRNTEQRIADIQQFLRDHSQATQTDTAYIERLLLYIERDCEQINVTRMAEFFETSISSLERFFRKKVGLTPKAYGDILKFRKQAEHVHLRPHIQAHYYDQSHLLKTSKKFAAKTIKELEETSDELTLRYLWKRQQS